MIIREAEERDVPYLMEIYNYEVKKYNGDFRHAAENIGGQDGMDSGSITWATIRCL